MQFINFFKELFDKAEEGCDFPDRDIIINSYQTSSPKHKLSSFQDESTKEEEIQQAQETS